MNANGTPRYLYLRRSGDNFKVGRAQKPRSAPVGSRFPGKLLDTYLVPVSRLGDDGAVSNCIEHATRLRFALATDGQMRLDPSPESVSVPPGLSDNGAIMLFRRSVKSVLDLIEKSEDQA